MQGMIGHHAQALETEIRMMQRCCKHHTRALIMVKELLSQTGATQGSERPPRSISWIR